MHGINSTLLAHVTSYRHLGIYNKSKNNKLRYFNLRLDRWFILILYEMCVKLVKQVDILIYKNQALQILYYVGSFIYGVMIQ